MASKRRDNAARAADTILSVARKWERAILIFFLFIALTAPVYKYAISLGRFDDDNGIAIHASAARHRQQLELMASDGLASGARADVAALGGPPPTVGLVPTPVACTVASRECKHWATCNRKKFQTIPSCKRGVDKCTKLPLHKQKLVPFCSTCLNGWRRITDCFREADACAAAQERCEAVWRSRKRKHCAAHTDPDKAAGHGRTAVKQVSQTCVTCHGEMVRAHNAAASMRYIAPAPPPTRAPAASSGGRRGSGRHGRASGRASSRHRSSPRSEAGSGDDDGDDGDGGEGGGMERTPYPTLSLPLL